MESRPSGRLSRSRVPRRMTPPRYPLVLASQAATGRANSAMGAIRRYAEVWRITAMRLCALRRASVRASLQAATGASADVPTRDLGVPRRGSAAGRSRRSTPPGGCGGSDNRDGNRERGAHQSARTRSRRPAARCSATSSSMAKAIPTSASAACSIRRGSSRTSGPLTATESAFVPLLNCHLYSSPEDTLRQPMQRWPSNSSGLPGLPCRRK